jgi:hypothetical protein
MIKTKEDYKEAKKRLLDEQKMITDKLTELKMAGLSGDHIKLAIDPLISFMLKIQDEVDEYERINEYEKQEQLVSQRDFDKIINELDNPSVPNKALKEAFIKHSQKFEK